MVSHNEETSWVLGEGNAQTVSRDIYADVIDTLVELGAAYIVFDVSFRQPGEESSNDLLAKAIAHASNVILFQYTQPVDWQKTVIVDKQSLIVGSHSFKEDEVLVQAEQSISPLAPFTEQALTTASFMLPQQQPIYAVSLFHPSPGYEQPLLPLIAYQVYQKAKIIEILKTYSNYYQLRENQLKPHISPRRLQQLISFLDNGHHKRFAIAFREHLADANTKRHINAIARAQGIKNMALIYRSDQPHIINLYGGNGTIKNITFQQLLQARSSTDKHRLATAIQDKVVFIGFSN